VNNYKTPDKNVIQSLFSRIAPRYDLLNLILSFGNDSRWRRIAVKKSVKPNDKTILDVGTGSGKLLKTYLEFHEFKKATGIDFSDNMLELAKKELASHHQVLLKNINLLEYDHKEEAFDIVSTSFVLRSIREHLADFFKKCFSLLNPGGRLVILELTRPENPFIRLLFFPYVKIYLPLVGRLISGEKSAYEFLSKSVINFKNREEVERLLSASGFKSVKIKLLSGGIGTLFIAEKSSPR